MKKRYLILSIGLILILCYFVFGNIYFSNYLINIDPEIEMLHEEKESILHEIDSTLYIIKQSHLESQNTIEHLSSQEYIQENTVIKNNILEKDSVIVKTIKQDTIIPVYIYDTLKVVIYDTIYNIIEVDSLVQEKKRKTGIFRK